PPLLLSDPLPAGFLPRPVLPPPHPDRENEVIASLTAGGRLPADPLERFDAWKALARRRYVSLSVLRRVLDGLSALSLAEAICQEADPVPPTMLTVPVAHNAIDRLTNHTLADGGLFFSPETFAAAPVEYDLWVVASCEPARVRELLGWAVEGGYGRDASTGKGHFTVDGIRPESLPAAQNPNAVMTLGPCAPAAGDPARGCWMIEPRFGKLGGPWAAQADGAGVFKHPLIFLAAGAVLAGPPRPFLGRIVPNVHPTRPEVVQYGLAVTIPVRCPDFEETS
ncbi:MAG TPA: hypothetical protein PLI31_08390, partial [Methanoregulaceae archaeon]|nr:hypothetical protein [Methanoregulaceae archaeon]